MKLRERDEHLDPRAERELEAIDRALAGERVDADLAGWAELTTLLREERPEPRQDWSAELDERAASGFRRGEGEASRPAGLGDRLSGLLPSRLAAPVGALATLAVVAVVAVFALNDGGGDESVSSDASSLSTTASEGATTGSAPEARGAAAAANRQTSGAAAADSSVRSLPTLPGGFAVSGGGKVAPGTEKRQVERDVTLALSPRPEEVRDVSDQAIAITRGLDGIVISSQISEAGKQASATLQLTIPTRNLDTALDRLTELANVKSLNESALDITRPYVSAQDRLADAEAQRRELLKALGNASTDAEAQALRIQIDDARREISRADSAFEKIARQARLSDVSLTIEGDPSAQSGANGRTIGDWLDDAVSVLRDVAGVLLISAAILVPLGLLIAIAWFAASTLRRRRREQVLD